MWGKPSGTIVATLSTFQKTDDAIRLVLYSSKGNLLGTRFGMSHDPSSTLILFPFVASDWANVVGVMSRIFRRRDEC
jgi:hypothetical protein